MTTGERLLARHGFPLAALVLLAAGTFGAALYIDPLDADNVVTLAFGERSPASFFTDGFTSYLPAYRPVSQLTVWAQYQLVGVATGSYFLVNIVLWVACAWALYALAYRLSRSRSASTLAAAALLVEPRAGLMTAWIAERQSALALLLGLTALVVALGSRPDRRPWVVPVAVFALLLAAALSKEYGLAFVPALVTLAWSCRLADRRALTAAAGLAVVAYAVLRLGLAGGATAEFCDEMGFFGEQRTVCYGELSFAEALEQRSYNAVAMLVATAFPSLFDGIGTLEAPTAPGLAVDLGVAALALFALVRRPRAVLPLVVLIAANGLLGFETFRERNHVIGIAALFAAAAIGLAELVPIARRRTGRWFGVVAIAATVLALAWVGLEAARRTQVISGFGQSSAAADPCAALRRYPVDVEARVVRRLAERYGLPRSDC